MSLIENIRMALSSVLAHKMRSILTMLGIIIGVAAVIIVVAIGQGGEQMIKSEITGASNTVDVYYQPPEDEMQVDDLSMMGEPIFTEDDIKALSTIPGVKNVVASSSMGMGIRYRDKESDTTVNAINEGYIEVNQLEVSKGRMLDSSDFLSGNRVGVITNDMKKELFDKKEALGQVVWVQGQPIKIIGVTKKPTGFLAFEMPTIYIPDNTYKSSFGKLDYTNLSVQAKSSDQLKKVGNDATDLLNNLHDAEDAYQVQNLEEIADSIGNVTRIMTTIIGSIAGISLLVGGIGVMNIMLVSVTERTREIGIRKALGASKRQILTQFLIESITLTLIGGLLGIGLGAGGAALVSLFAGWPSLISWQVVLGGVLFSMTIGIVFGMLPANKAAKLDPIEALRYE
ncbi:MULTISPECIES: ABC transporter permease [Priestia]|uniref:ABC transporter permease n=1 Tax=Priestia TaxID=2800373 RepID=UPI0005EC55E4|nr:MULTISPECIES: ABC transporter permease [Priestia]KJL03257.1 macrolide ABC transporter permease [Priestia aryabhattai B8W22]MBX4161070.1 ABC transporter permease [Priestia megaterium]MED3895721.1 ABC transporter permease [Priestia aryabhattai]